MKKTLMLSALTFAIAGGITGCANCGSCCGGDEVMEVEAMEVITCPACKQKIKCKKHHHTKDCQNGAQCKAVTACADHSEDKDAGSTTTKAETANCGECGKEHKDGQENQPQTTASVLK